MFGAPQPPSKAELQEAEEQTAMSVRWTAVGCVVLYFSPFVVDWARKLV